MRANPVRLGRVVGTAGAVLLLGVLFPHDTASGPAGPTRVGGGGDTTAAAFVQYVGHDGVIRNVPSINTIGNRITFGFNATESVNGYVEGQMQLVDHAEGLVIHSDVASLSVPHGVHNRPVGSTGVTFSMSSSVGGVMVNGQLQAGWRFVNSPGFDGGEGSQGSGDTICFELFDAARNRIRQWSAFVASGNVQVVP